MLDLWPNLRVADKLKCPDRMPSTLFHCNPVLDGSRLGIRNRHTAVDLAKQTLLEVASSPGSTDPHVLPEGLFDHPVQGHGAFDYVKT